MKKFLSCIAAAVYLLSFFSCSNDLNDSKNLFLLQSFGSNSEYGTIVVGGSDYDSRKLTSSDLTNLNATVSGYGMDDVTGTVTSDSGKTSGKVTVEKVTTGKNRVISIDSGKAVIRELIPEVNAGINTIPNVTWDTTVLGSIYYYLIKAGVDVSSIDKSVFENVIPTDVHACLVNAQQIAVDYAAGNLKTGASSYKLSAGTVTATVYGYSGKTIQIADPSSSVQTAGADGTTVTFTDVLPGKWNVYADGNKVKTITVVSGNNEVTIGSSISGRVIVFANDSEKKTFYIWKNETETSYSAGWPGSAATAATDDMMNNPAGWSYVDITDKYDGGSINLILNNNGSNQTGDLKTGKTATFWYDAAGTCGTAGTFYDSDPTENQLSSDATLASISVNGTALSGFASGTTSYTAAISAATTSATVTATANDSAASVSVSPSGSASIASGESQVFTITVTAEDGSTKTYTVTVKRAAENDTTLASILVNGKTATISGTTASINITGNDDSLSITSIVATAADSNASVTYSATTGTIADGASKNFTITVKNGSKTATYALTVSYSQQTTPEYYWTNKNGHFGTNKTISSFSDWTEAEKIVQAAANDDPRVFCHWAMHEVPCDAYAMYAAYDSTNLYLMVELTNVQDIVASDNNYPLSDNGQYWNRGTPFFFAFETGKGVGGDGSMISTADPYVWNSAVQFSANNVDTMIVCHSEPAKGKPGVFYTNSEGLFSYASDLCLTFPSTGVEVTWDGGANKPQGITSSEIWGIKAVGTDQGRLVGNMNADTYIDFNTLNHDNNLDLKWQIKIPLTALRITESELKSNGIGVMFVISDGASGMDCLPWDPSMVDNAATPYSLDESSTKEREDVDIITTSFARIGK